MSQDSWDEQQPEQSRPGNDKEWKLLEKLLMQSGKESRRARRWGIFFKSLTFVYLFVILFLFMVFTSQIWVLWGTCPIHLCAFLHN